MNQTKSSYDILPGFSDLNFQGIYSKIQSFTFRDIAYDSYFEKSSLSMKKSWSESSSQNQQYST